MGRKQGRGCLVVRVSVVGGEGEQQRMGRVGGSCRVSNVGRFC